MALFDSSSNLFVRGKQLFTVNYEAGKNTLPEEQGWNYIDPTNMPNQPSVVGAKLFQGPTEYVGTQFWEIFPDNLIDFISGTLIWEIQAKVIGSSDDISPPSSWRTGWQANVIDQNKRGFALGLSESGVRLTNDLNTPTNELANSIEIPFNTIDDSHIYRLEIANGSGQVFIDGSGAGILAVDATAAEQTANHMWFGDGTNGASGQTELLYLHTDIFYPELHQNDLNLYTQASTIISVSGTLMIHGVVLTPSPTGSIDGKFIDEIDIVSDFIPSLVGRFTTTSPLGVTIEVWDIRVGANIALTLLDDTVLQIGDTESWLWSMSDMPLGSKADGYFLFRMIADTGETIEKQVNIRTISDGQWKS